MRGFVWAFVFAVALIASVDSALAQRETAAQNVRESQLYDQLICTNPSFRANRIAIECGPLRGSQFYESCAASFTAQCGPNPPHGRDWRGAPSSERVR